MASPTNADIMNAIAEIKTQLAVVETISTATKTQAEKTNGRVTKIEEWKNALEAVDRYKKENPSAQINAPQAKTVIAKPRWFQNKQLATSAAAVLTAIAAAIGIVVGRIWGTY